MFDEQTCDDKLVMLILMLQWKCKVGDGDAKLLSSKKRWGDTISKILVAWTFQFEFVQNMKVEVRWIHLYLCKIWALKLKRK